MEKVIKAVHDNFVKMSKRELYVTDCGELFEYYLSIFPEGTNPIFRTRALYDCQTCRQFIRRLGGLVTVENGKVHTVWDGAGVEAPFDIVAERLAEHVRNSKITAVFRTKERQYGMDHNYDPKTNERYDHFYGKVSDRHFCNNPEEKRGEEDAIFQVFKRGLTELREADCEAVLDLINSNGLYRGEEHKPAVTGFLTTMRNYKAAGSNDLYIWENLQNRNARFRNTVIGTLLVELAEGKDLDNAVRAFEVKVAPANYKRPTAIITQKMVEDATQTMTDLGLHGAIARRYAKIGDVSVNDVLFVDNSTRGLMKDGIAAILEGSVKKATPNTKDAAKITSDQFINDVLPKAKSLEVLVNNRHTGNFVSLTGADGPERLFRWDNNFAWSYDGDVTDSVKQRVKAAGGNINCKMRISLSWFNFDDLDLHAYTPNGTHIFFGSKLGILDVDMNAGRGSTRTPVENLAFNNLQNGTYVIKVHQFCRRETADVGFAIEVESNGVLNQYSYPKSVTNGGTVDCFKLHVQNGELVKIETTLTGGSSSQEKWGVKTESLTPVSAVLYSPNYWGSNSVGSKHLIFALKGCKNPGSTRGIYNEFLRPDLEKHRKVFEVLGNKTKCAPSEEQISGVGFTAARGDSVTVVVDGSRPYVLSF